MKGMLEVEGVACWLGARKIIGIISNNPQLFVLTLPNVKTEERIKRNSRATKVAQTTKKLALFKIKIKRTNRKPSNLNINKMSVLYLIT
jgi:hypothetical protein